LAIILASSLAIRPRNELTLAGNNKEIEKAPYEM